MTRPKFCEALGLCHICYFSTTRRNAGVGLSSLVLKYTTSANIAQAIFNEDSQGLPFMRSPFAYMASPAGEGWFKQKTTV